MKSVLLIASVALILGSCSQDNATSLFPFTPGIILGGDVYGDTVVTGMLTIVDPSDCWIPEGCGPKYKLWNEDFSGYFPLLGDIDDRLSQLVIEAGGKWVQLPEDEVHDLNYRGPRVAFEVQSYAVRSLIRYHDYLVPAAQRFAKDQYGCEIYWNKTFSWQIVDGNAEIAVRMTNSFASEDPQPFVEFACDGVFGMLRRTTDNLDGKSPCRS